jgi:hypothetical protein
MGHASRISCFSRLTGAEEILSISSNIPKWEEVPAVWNASGSSVAFLSQTNPSEPANLYVSTFGSAHEQCLTFGQWASENLPPGDILPYGDANTNGQPDIIDFVVPGGIRISSNPSFKPSGRVLYFSCNRETVGIRLAIESSWDALDWLEIAHASSSESSMLLAPNVPNLYVDQQGWPNLSISVTDCRPVSANRVFYRLRVSNTGL